MNLLLAFILTILTFHNSHAINNVVVQVPPAPNVSFPNLPAPIAPTATDPLPKEQSVAPQAQQHSERNDYLKTLFEEVEVAKKAPLPMSNIKIHEKLAKQSVAYGVLKDHPNLQVGPFEFRALAPAAPHTKEIMRGQELLLHTFGNHTYTYKELTDVINYHITDPHSPYSDTDWIFMSNAFRTLKAPGGNAHQSHILGGLLSEYVLLSEIQKIESKNHLSLQDRSLLSTLHYDLSQIYQSIYQNDDYIFREKAPGLISLPIDRAYWGPHHHYGYPTEYVFPFDIVMATWLDLLKIALLLDPWDSYSWAHLIDFCTFDLVDPWYYKQLTPVFWINYFPYGFRHEYAKKLQHKWKDIRHHHGIHTNHHIRLNGPYGAQAIKNLSKVHGQHKSQFNKTIRRVSHEFNSADIKEPSHKLKNEKNTTKSSYHYSMRSHEPASMTQRHTMHEQSTPHAKAPPRAYPPYKHPSSTPQQMPSHQNSYRDSNRNSKVYDKEVHSKESHKGAFRHQERTVIHREEAKGTHRNAPHVNENKGDHRNKPHNDDGTPPWKKRHYQ
jgi:hypothetical protein